ncbi:hypothetical protein EAE96_008873 [Botrytis aclada]|nr:hypothetical protein EAE96_008873 [Botrytis aclada]
MKRQFSSAYPPAHATYSTSASTSTSTSTGNTSAPQYNQNFPRPSLNLQRSSAYSPVSTPSTSASIYTSKASAPRYDNNYVHASMNQQRSSAYLPNATSSTYAYGSAGNASGEYVLPATTYPSPAQKTHHRNSDSSSRLSKASCSTDTCSQPSLPPSPKLFDRRPTQQWLSQLPCDSDISVRPVTQDIKSDSGGSHDREISGRSNRSISGSSSLGPIPVGSSSRSKGRLRMGNGLYETEYNSHTRRPLVSRETRK